MSEQDGTQVSVLPPNDQETWKAQGQPWRTKPEISTKRQGELKQCLERKIDIETGTYHFKDVKLSRADVEWLLSRHESGDICGPVDLSDEQQREREGLDLRGAYLEGEDLSGLPLARLRGGLTLVERRKYTKEQRVMAAVQLQRADLRGTNLQESVLQGANLQKANLTEANLQKAMLWDADLQGAGLWDADLQQADLAEANLKKADLGFADLQQAILRDANLQQADLRDANLQQARLLRANLQEAILRGGPLTTS